MLHLSYSPSPCNKVTIDYGLTLRTLLLCPFEFYLLLLVVERSKARLDGGREITGHIIDIPTQTRTHIPSAKVSCTRILAGWWWNRTPSELVVPTYPIWTRIQSSSGSIATTSRSSSLWVSSSQRWLVVSCGETGSVASSSGVSFASFLCSKRLSVLIHLHTGSEISHLMTATPHVTILSPPSSLLVRVIIISTTSSHPTTAMPLNGTNTILPSGQSGFGNNSALLMIWSNSNKTKSTRVVFNRCRRSLIKSVPNLTGAFLLILFPSWNGTTTKIKRRMAAASSRWPVLSMTLPISSRLTQEERLWSAPASVKTPLPCSTVVSTCTATPRTIYSRPSVLVSSVAVVRLRFGSGHRRRTRTFNTRRWPKARKSSGRVASLQWLPSPWPPPEPPKKFETPQLELRRYDWLVGKGIPRFSISMAFLLLFDFFFVVLGKDVELVWPPPQQAKITALLRFVHTKGI